MKKAACMIMLLSALAMTGCVFVQESGQTAMQGQPLIEPQRLVGPSDLVSGGPPKDGIPSIDNPEFESLNESSWLNDNDLVFVLAGESEVRAYPQPILVWHEIVNDYFEGEPVAVTYCPLCGSSVAYKRLIDGEAVEFGTTGMLYNSNLVMYDRKTDTFWTQIKGEAIIGELSGQVLEKVPLQALEWKALRERFPKALVLSRKTGSVRLYGTDPYGNYYTDHNALYFPVKGSDSRLNAKDVVIGLSINGESKAYPEKLIARKAIKDSLGAQDITIESDEDGFVKITGSSGEMLAWERDYWFAWYAFHPGTLVYAE